MSTFLVLVTMVELQVAATAHTAMLGWQPQVIPGAFAVALMLTNLKVLGRFGPLQPYGRGWFLAGLGVLAGAAFLGLVSAVAEASRLHPDVLLLSITFGLWPILVRDLSAIAFKQAVQLARQARERREHRKMALRLLAGEQVGPQIAARLLAGASVRPGEKASSRSRAAHRGGGR